MQMKAATICCKGHRRTFVSRLCQTDASTLEPDPQQSRQLGVLAHWLQTYEPSQSDSFYECWIPCHTHCYLLRLQMLVYTSVVLKALRFFRSPH